MHVCTDTHTHTHTHIHRQPHVYTVYNLSHQHGCLAYMSVHGSGRSQPLIVANIRVREWHKWHHSLTFDSKWPTLTKCHGHAHALWHRVTNSTMFVLHRILTVLTDFKAERTNSLGGVRSQTLEKKTTEPNLPAGHGHALRRRVAKEHNFSQVTSCEFTEEFWSRTDKCCGRSSFKYNSKKDDIIEYGRLWQHATATPFDVESQIAQLFSSSIFWTYNKNLKPKRQPLPSPGRSSFK